MTDFKQFEQDAWESAVDQYDTSFGKLTRQTIPRMLDVLEVGRGTEFLDVACGPGYLAAEAAQRGAGVLGVDFAAAMVEKARKHYPYLTFEFGDAEDLEGITDGQFDVAGMNFGILHLAHPEKAVDELHRVLATKGRAAFTAWREPGETLGFGIVLRAIEKFGNPKVSLPEGPPFFNFGDPAECEAILDRFGFIPHAETINLTWTLKDPEELFTAFLQGTARTGGMLKRQTPEQLARIRAAVADEAQQFLHGSEVVVPMPANLAWGIKK